MAHLACAVDQRRHPVGRFGGANAFAKAQRLEAKGLVQRVRSTTDRRNVTIATTAKGRALAQELLPQANAIHAHIETLMSQDDWDAMAGALKKLSSAVQTLHLADVRHPPQTPKDFDHA